MKLMNAAVLLAALSASACAHGDAIVSGGVSNTNDSGGMCASAGASASSISLNCGSGSDGLAQVSASVGSLDASMSVFLASFGSPTTPGASTVATTSLSWVIDGTYMLTGGSGYGYVDWSAISYRFGEGGGGLFGPCSITLNGVTETCDLNGGFANGSFLVPYDTPVTLIFGASYSADATDFDAVYGGMDFDIDRLKPVDPSTMPEPPTWMLMATVAFGILFCIRMRSAGSAG